MMVMKQEFFGMYSKILTYSNHLRSNWFQVVDGVRGPFFFFFLSVRPLWLIPEASLLFLSTSLIKNTRPFIIRWQRSLRKCWGRGLAPLSSLWSSISGCSHQSSFQPYRPFETHIQPSPYWLGEIECTRIWTRASVIEKVGCVQRGTWRLPQRDISLSHYGWKGCLLNSCLFFDNLIYFEDSNNRESLCIRPVSFLLILKEFYCLVIWCHFMRLWVGSSNAMECIIDTFFVNIHSWYIFIINGLKWFLRALWICCAWFSWSDDLSMSEIF